MYGIDVTVKKLQRPWKTAITHRGGGESLEIDDGSGRISLIVHDANRVSPFMAVFGTMMFCSENYHGSSVQSEQKNGQPARAWGTVVLQEGAPAMRLEVRAWKVPGTDKVAMLTGIWPDDKDETRLQDLNALLEGVHAAPK